MEQIIDFLKHFSPTTTPPELVAEYFQVYQAGNGSSLVYNTHGQSDAAKKNRGRVKVIRGGKCAICGFDNIYVLDTHHVRPTAVGGTDEIENLSCLCKNCHVLVHHTMNTNDFVGVRDVFTAEQYRKFKKMVHYRRR